MSSITIGILGCSAFNPNLGCAALHYSLLALLEEIGKEREYIFKYIIFDYEIDCGRASNIIRELGIESERCVYIQAPKEFPFWTAKGIVKKILFVKNNVDAYRWIKRCDLVVDLSQGDSFSDIYGKQRFFEWSAIKEKIEKYKIPLILGPQTYGPYYDNKARDYAIRIINGADLVISRDDDSKEYVNRYTDKEIIAGTDLAFRLPYISKKKQYSEKILIGINPSGLLGKKRNDGSDLKDKLMVDYDKYISDLVKYLVKAGKYEIHFISHVGNEAIECFGNISGVIYHDAFTSPIDVKNLISGLDVFVGARMHATIAAFSSGVATIPTAYSMKFNGVFSGIGYQRIVDLRTESTDSALKKTIDYIEEYDLAKIDYEKCRSAVDSRYKKMKDALSDYIDYVYSSK